MSMLSSARPSAFHQCAVCTNRLVLVSYPGFSSMFSFLPLRLCFTSWNRKSNSSQAGSSAVRAKFDEEESDQLEAEKPNAFFTRSEEAKCWPSRQESEQFVSFYRMLLSCLWTCMSSSFCVLVLCRFFWFFLWCFFDSEKCCCGIGGLKPHQYNQ